MTIAIFTEPEVINCFSKIALVIIRENKTKLLNFATPKHQQLAAILKTESSHCYSHLAVIIARENEVLDQSACVILDNHQCNFTKIRSFPLVASYTADFHDIQKNSMQLHAQRSSILCSTTQVCNMKSVENNNNTFGPPVS